MNKYIMIIALVLFGTNVMANDTVTTWLQNEKTKTVEYQKKSWAEGKEQLKNNTRTLYQKAKQLVFRITRVLT